jgi:uncharacterized damage-inducible protein DinB
MSHLQTLIRSNIDLVRQGLGVLEKLDDESYRRAAPQLGSGGIGVHFRHCIDFYTCLLRDLGAGRVDYDQRLREPRLETDRQLALERLRELAAGLGALDAHAPERPLEVRVDAASPDSAWSRSSLARELQALLSHTVHHFSAVAMLLHQQGRRPPEGFGVAPSTLRHWREHGRSHPQI